MSEEFASDAQIKRLYAVLHSLKLDPKEWKKKQGFGNYAKLTPPQCSEYIDDLEELEAKAKRVYKGDNIKDDAPQLPTAPSGYTSNGLTQQTAPAGEFAAEMLHLEQIMRFSMQAANAIVDSEISSCGADSTAALIKQKIGVSLFMEATSRRL